MEVLKAPVTFLRPRFWTVWSLFMRVTLGWYGLNHSWEPYVMTGMTQVLKRRRRWFWLMPAIVLPKQDKPEMMFLALAQSMLT